MRRILIIILFAIFILMVAYLANYFRETPSTLKQLAYDVNKEHGYTIYLKENNEYVPYIVLTDDYNGSGNTLLLRKYPLSEERVFDDSGRNIPSYYNNSDIDIFLNNDFYESLSEEVQDKIIYSDISITNESSIGVTGEETETISRKVFLLAYSEVIEPRSSSTLNNEGELLKYFEDGSGIEQEERRIAYTENGESSSWWLRTPDTWYSNISSGVGENGGIGAMPHKMTGSYENPTGMVTSGVRPAFCMPNDVSIVYEFNENESRYILNMIN